MFKRLISAGAAALAGLTAACQDGPATIPGWQSAATWSSMVYATSKGPMLLQVHGQLFGQDAGAQAANLANGLGNHVQGRPFAFTTDQALAPEAQLRVILALNPPANLDARRLCTAPPPSAAAIGDKITAMAVFCEHQTLLSSINGWVSRTSGPDDPRFQQLLAQMGRDLFGRPQ